jgi:LuxR family transcriptional regulator of csgAB operon
VILWDRRERSLESVLIDLDFLASLLSSLPCLVLFNVKPNLGIEERCVWKGIRGFFYENDPLDHFLKGIHAVLKGELWLSREIMTKCILEGKGREDTSSDKTQILTSRQVEILALVSIGASNDQISESLCISTHTVKTHLSNIFKKIKVPNRLQAALWSAKNLEPLLQKYYSTAESLTALAPRPPVMAKSFDHDKVRKK